MFRRGRHRPAGRRGSGAIISATPISIVGAASVVAAYDARFVALNGGNVVGLPDQSVNGWNGVQATAGFQPLYNATDAAFGGNPSIEGDGVDDIIDFALPIPAPGTTPRFYYWIGRQLGWTSGRVLFGGNGGLCQDVFQNAASPQLRQYNNVNGAVNTNSPVAGAARRCTALFTNSASDQLVIGSVGSVPGNSGNNSSSDWHIFGGGAAGQFSRWSFSYMLIMNRAATAPELTALDALFLGRGFPATILA